MAVEMKGGGGGGGGELVRTQGGKNAWIEQCNIFGLMRGQSAKLSKPFYSGKSLLLSVFFGIKTKETPLLMTNLVPSIRSHCNAETTHQINPQQ